MIEIFNTIASSRLLTEKIHLNSAEQAKIVAGQAVIVLMIIAKDTE